MGPFTLALTSLAVEQVLAEQASVKWRAQHKFHLPSVQVPLEFLVDGIVLVIRSDWKPAPINVAEPPTMAKKKPPTDWL
jgi:hypothetical protein